MDKDLLFDGKIYISVGRASKRLGYTADYIGQLCRAGKVNARMLGRTWYVEWDSLKNHKKNKKHRIRRTAAEIRAERERLASETVLKESEEECPPEEEIRKIETKVKLETPESGDKLLSEPILSSILLEEPEFAKKILEKKEKSESRYFISSNEEWLPKLSKEKILKTEPRTFAKAKHSILSPDRFALLALIAIIFGSFYFLENLGGLAKKPMGISLIVNSLEEKFAKINEKEGTISATENSQGDTNITSIYGGLKREFGTLTDSFKQRINSYAISYLRSLGYEKTVPVEVNNPIKEGLVVAPNDENHNAKVASIKKTFSDEVVIKEDADGQSGVIVPKFKEVNGDAYTYVLIPINSP